MIPLVDLKAQHASIRPELDEAIRQVLDSGGFVLGETVARFEKEFATAVGSAHAVGMNSGTDALQLILEAIRLQRAPGEVVTTPFTFFATAEAVLNAGHLLRFADIEEDSFNLDPRAVRAAAGPRTVAVMPVHLYGGCADIDGLRLPGVALVEDAAQAIGASYKGRKAGTLGFAAGFSFYPTKNLGAAGDAGAVTTDDADLAAHLRRLRAHGETKAKEGRTYHYTEIGHNSRLDGLQAAILLVKLRHVEAWQARRGDHAAFYDRALQSIDGVRPPPCNPFGRHVYHQYVIRAQRRDALRDHLQERGIETRIFYPEPLHLQPALARFGMRSGQFPAAERAAGEALSIPVHPFLTEGQRTQVVEEIRRFYGAR